MTSSNFRLIGSEVDCFKKLVYETLTQPGKTTRHAQVRDDGNQADLDRIEGAAIADPETGSNSGNLLHLTCSNAFWELRDL
jgi:hypothetical protein